MSTPTITLREILLDSLHDSYWMRQARVEECPACRKHPAGACTEHQEDAGLARDYERARKQIEGSTADPDAAEELAALLGDEGEQS